MCLVQKALTLDDVLLVPAYLAILPRDTSLRTKLTRSIELAIPLTSVAMDTVTEARLAIAMAQQGGIGIVHKNLKPEEQVRKVARAKRSGSDVLRDPVAIGPDVKIHDVMTLSAQHGISGFPVLEGKKVVGIITNHDLRFGEKLDVPVCVKMMPSEKLVTVKESASLEEAERLTNKHRLECVLMVGEAFELRDLITVKDIQKATEYPLVSKDERGPLHAGVAVGVGPDNDLCIDLLAKAGVDVITADTAHGHSQGVLDRVYRIKDNYPRVQVIGGSIATGDAIRVLVDHGVDGAKVGIDSGSICTTRIVAGMGVPQILVVSNVVEALKGIGVPLIADGGIRHSGSVAKVLAAGAHITMVGGTFVGTDESPGEVFLFQGCSYKSYRGMGLVGVMKDGAADRYFQEDNTANVDKPVPEGIKGRVLYKGSAPPIVYQLAGGIRSSMGYCGCTSITEWHEKAQFVEITAAGINESHVHDVQTTKEAPNRHRN